MRYLALITAGVLLACSPYGEAEFETSVSDLEGAVHSMVRKDEPVCGEALDGTDSMLVLVVSKAQCWGCSEVGYGVRRWQRAHSGAAMRLLIAAPASDGGDVCRYAAAEKLDVPVYEFYGSSGALALASRFLVVFTLTESGVTWDTAASAVDLLIGRLR